MTEQQMGEILWWLVSLENTIAKGDRELALDMLRVVRTMLVECEQLAFEEKLGINRKDKNNGREVAQEI